MIYEFALEPELVATWTDRRDARYFMEMFGLGRPRLVSHFPKRWKSLIWDAFNRSPVGGDDMQRKRMEELITRLGETMVRREGSSWDANRPWLVNAEQEHDRRPFKAILSRENPRARAEVLLPQDLENGGHSRWSVAQGVTVSRQARDMAEVMRALLGCCREVIFVDPYFAPEEPRYRRPLESFLDALVAGRAVAEMRKVEVHTKVRSTAEFFRDSCGRELQSRIPVDLRVVFRRWTERTGGEVLHNRYILTELGGVTFSHGLDDGRNGETDDVSLMDREQYELRWKQYTGDAPAFDLAEEPVIIEGSKVPRR